MKTNNRKKIYVFIMLFMLVFLLTGCGTRNDNTEIPNHIKNMFSGGILDIFVWPMAKLLYFIGKYITGGNYGLALIISTIIIRTIAWPIYAKTNDMSLKMQIMAPEQAKIEAKYEGRTDETSVRNKQLEMMQLYKKYGVGIGGCLMPLIQFPIFIAFYSVVRRVQVTPWLNDILSFKFLGIDLSADRTIGGRQQTAIFILAALVGLTQVGSQILMTYRQKQAKETTQSNIPEYRRPAQTEQQMQTEKTMKFMLYGMTIMMVVFVVNSPAGLGLYWLIGNLYSTLQSTVSHKLSGRRMEKLRGMHNGLWRSK